MSLDISHTHVYYILQAHFCTIHMGVPVKLHGYLMHINMQRYIRDNLLFRGIGGLVRVAHKSSHDAIRPHSDRDFSW